LNSARQFIAKNDDDEDLTFTSDIVEYTDIKVFSVTHFVIQDNLPLEIEYRDMSPIERDSGLILSSTPSVEYARHGGREL
jgi:hypothetical protein